MTLSIRNTKILLGLILVLAAVLRFYHIDYQSLWLDEVLTMNSANPELSLKELYESVMYWEYIPHLYFYLNRILFEIFGYTSFVARVFSAIVGIMGVYAIYLLGKEIFNKRVGLIAALLLAVNIYHISYSQEIRPYGMLFLFSILSFYRLVIYIKETSVRNAIYYGIFTGLIVNAHFFGLITIFSQSLILLYFLSLKPKEERFIFFKNMLIAAAVAILFALPAIEPFIRVSKIESFWMPKPDGQVYTILFKEFFGNSEMLMYFIQVIIIYYGISLFRKKLKRYDYETVLENKLIFSFIILCVWLIISMSLPLIKSHLGASMMVNRYFISILAVLLVVIAIGVALIKNIQGLAIVLSCLVCFSLIDLFIVKDYYNKISKTQYKEMAQVIKENNPENNPIMTFYSWILPYYFRDEPQQQIINNTLEKQVEAIKAGTMSMAPFWYVDFNGRPYEISAEGEKYLNANFRIAKKLVYNDIWANFYVPKSYISIGKQADGSEYLMYGSKDFFENGTYKSYALNLEKGNYTLTINGISTPQVPLNGENAHFTVKYAGKVIGSIYLSEKPDKLENKLSFSCKGTIKGKVELIYDNDVYENNIDRNARLYSVKINKNE